LKSASLLFNYANSASTKSNSDRAIMVRVISLLVKVKLHLVWLT